jgi:hypothetical protein
MRQSHRRRIDIKREVGLGEVSLLRILKLRRIHRLDEDARWMKNVIAGDKQSRSTAIRRAASGTP